MKAFTKSSNAVDFMRNPRLSENVNREKQSDDVVKSDDAPSALTPVGAEY
jgi:hypothetical protein